MDFGEVENMNYEHQKNFDWISVRKKKHLMAVENKSASLIGVTELFHGNS